MIDYNHITVDDMLRQPIRSYGEAEIRKLWGNRRSLPLEDVLALPFGEQETGCWPAFECDVPLPVLIQATAWAVQLMRPAGNTGLICAIDRWVAEPVSAANDDAVHKVAAEVLAERRLLDGNDHGPRLANAVSAYLILKPQHKPEYVRRIVVDWLEVCTENLGIADDLLSALIRTALIRSRLREASRAPAVSS